MFKKILKIFLFGMFVSLGFLNTNYAFAESVSTPVLEKEVTTSVSEDINGSSTTLIDSDKPLTAEETEKIINEIEKGRTKPDSVDATGVSIKYYVVRSGNSSSCELLARVDATGPVKSIWIETATVQSTSIINRKVYKTFKKVLRSVGASAGTVTIGSVSIPSGVRSVNVKTSGVEAETYADGWGSLVSFNGNVVIN